MWLKAEAVEEVTIAIEWDTPLYLKEWKSPMAEEAIKGVRDGGPVESYASIKRIGDPR